MEKSIKFPAVFVINFISLGQIFENMLHNIFLVVNSNAINICV